MDTGEPPGYGLCAAVYVHYLLPDALRRADAPCAGRPARNTVTGRQPG